MEITFEKQDGGFVEITTSEVEVTTYEDINLRKRW